MSNLQSLFYFPSAVYKIHKPEFLTVAKEVSEDYISKVKKMVDFNKIYPVYMTEHFFNDPRMNDICNFIGGTAWNILKEQGYSMDNLLTYFTDMWAQEHYRHSLNEEHVHGEGSQISGFYFIECPENSSKLVLHDPKIGKVLVGLKEADIAKATIASNKIAIKPEVGDLVFINSWLNHSFDRHASDEQFKFIHFNISVKSK
jgi:uncharacterized protein (TIGR02466 family)